MATPWSLLHSPIASARRWWENLSTAATPVGPGVEDEPLRAELFSAEQMAAHGQRLAASHRLGDAAHPDALLARLASNHRVLLRMRAQLSDSDDSERRFSPAGEWLLDNFYLIEEEVRTARMHLPRGYSRELPRLAADPAVGVEAGTPRVYALALQAVAHGDGQIGRGTLTRFVASYQSVQPLLLGELWALPIMLRLALIENLRRVAARVAVAHSERATAAAWADGMLEVAERAPSELILHIADMARSNPPLTNAFVAEFARRLQGRGAALALPLTWMEQRLAESGHTIEQLVQHEGQQQAANQVSVSNSIGSLRLLAATNWRDFVEGLSGVEQALREDPAGVYARMDFASRDEYRHAVEAIARMSPRSEAEVARAAVALADAANASGPGGDVRAGHVGFHLFGEGRVRLEQAVTVRLPAHKAIARAAKRRALPLYAAALVLLTLALSLPPLFALHLRMDWPWWGEAALAVALLLAASQLAVSLVNWGVTLLVAPRPLPRMDYGDGIGPQSRTLVVVPTMLGSEAAVDALVDALEVRFLANRDRHLHFGLLTDFHDAAQEQLPGDEALVDLAARRIAALNERYRDTEQPAEGDTFFLFHRPRRWNASERVWMGHERKRGKLADLNALLRGSAGTGSDARFARIAGDTRALAGVRYVITLDTDTQLPREAAAQIVATMAHPLNQPRFGSGARSDRVVEGYGILQPRVGLSLPSVNRSGYARLFGGEPGIDPYTRAVSDVYQDLFGEGSFIGKGIYEVDAFERALAGRLPENRILSHDLLEGCYARSGLLSDVQLLEESPTRYRADVARRHRWIRGDWQLIGWLLPGGPAGRKDGHALSALSRAKILDNLRRSLVPASLLAVLLAGWAVLPWPAAWTLAAVAVVALVPLLGDLLDRLGRPWWRMRDARAGSTPPHGTLQWMLQALHSLACLPHEAAYSVDAILRTLWRLVLSRRRLLEWRPSAEVETSTAAGSLQDLAHTARDLAVGPVFALGATVALALWRPEALPVAAPLLLLWLVSPLLVWWLDQPLRRKREALTSTQTAFLRRVARRTWAFFETHVGADDHHLPPDNMQEQPVARVAHRTSPTNIGFALLATLSARDFGYLTSAGVVARLQATLSTMERMERHRGHLFNWYDTTTLQPLRPHYVSTVDSGNLAAQLLTLRSGLLTVADAPLLPSNWFVGVADTVAVLQEAVDARAAAPQHSQAEALVRFARQLQHHARDLPRSLRDWQQRLDDLAQSAAGLDAVFRDAAADVSPDASGGAAHVEGEEEECAMWARLLAAQCRSAADELSILGPAAQDDAPLRPDDAAFVLPTLRELASSPGEAGAARARLQAIEDLAARAAALAEMDQSFLYDASRHLMTIGYNLEERRIDTGYYDLLASEARLGVFVAIAQGHIGQESWFALGRLLTSTADEPVLLSWSGSMFEYLMPMLLMPSYENTLLEVTCQGAVRQQIRYGAQRGVPWGISESGYNATDTALNYQYRAFGVPGLGLKRGLAEDLVVAPYASMLALMVEPQAACENLQRLADEGAAGRFGFYEAVDYTPARLPRGQRSAVVRSFMAHHQGMGLLALAHLLHDRSMQRHFEADAGLQSTLLLLQERVPRMKVFQAELDEGTHFSRVEEADRSSVRVITDPDTPAPEVQLLSNGRYHVMVTQAGGGYSRWKDMAVSRWQEDPTRDAWGSFCYLRDVASGDVWSTAHQPTCRVADSYEAIFSVGRAEFRRRDHGIDTHTEIVVSPEDDIELRRVRITNNSRTTRTIEVTAYTELVLAHPVADMLHPAFSKLFVQTELLEEPSAVLCTRRRRSPEEDAPWMFQLMAVHGARAVADGGPSTGPVSHETDRARFIGRGNALDDPQAMRAAGPLSNTSGSVLDPIAASRCSVTLAPDQSIVIDVVMGMGATRAACVALAAKHRDRRLADRVLELAWTHAQVVLRQLNASEADSQLYTRLGSAVIHAHSALRADPAVLLRNRRGQSGLWGYAISGDLPIVLLQIGSADSIELVRQLVQAHAWWRLKGLAVDLVIWNQERDIYRQRLQEQIMGLIAAGVEAHVIDRPGGIFVRHVDQIAPEDRVLLQSVARAVFSDEQGSLSEQVNRRVLRERRAAALVPSRARELRLPPPSRPAIQPPELGLFNGIGGFSAHGHEYVVTPPPGVSPPAPWVNVLANPRFGTVISEAGSAYTWCENAHELRLTPWHNDPVSDGCGEAIYLRDEETGAVWSPTSLPMGQVPPAGHDDPHAGRFTARHGFGYSVFEHSAFGIRCELTVFVDLHEAVKFSVLRLFNESGRPRKLSATGYVEWVLGDLRPRTAAHIVTEMAPLSAALYARNPYSNDYGDWIGFFDVDEAQRAGGSFTCDRAEFIGRHGSMRMPAAMGRVRLTGRTGAALDPCAAIQVQVQLAAGEASETVFRLGMGRSADEAGQLVDRFRGPTAAAQALEAVQRHWRQTLGAVQVHTPDPALDVLANGWLLYQTIACRIWARSGYYQSGGAFGFRDQLQDAMALVHAQPQMLRDQLLLCASRQFAEGDVQHWWHPPQGRGVRTRISDDYLWLPLALARYVEATADTGVLDERVPFLEGRAVNPQDESYYDLPLTSTATADLYEHASRALWHGLRYGAHGLPLMGSGDWNDGMNRVGHEGKGESVWLGFFLCEVLARFGELARRRADEATAQRCAHERAGLQASLERHGWDGSWYRRAYFDDGTPLGSAQGAECRIDSIAQSWAVLSGTATPERARQALDALHMHLVRPQAQLVQLLDPPFDQRGPNPGYIAGYVPGVRENGGQYTHGAIWAAMAFAQVDDAARAWALAAMINPVHHAGSPEAVMRYKVEPYVMAADVYSVAPHTGRGGWSWYTGSAGWMYRLIVESLLGVRRVSGAEGPRLAFSPCPNPDWSRYQVDYRHHGTSYRITVELGAAPEAELRLDGVRLPEGTLPLTDDGHEHTVELRLPRRAA